MIIYAFLPTLSYLTHTAATATPPVRVVQPGEKVAVTLNNSDTIFSEIRNLSIERLGSFMQEKAVHIRERYSAFKNNKDASLTEIHDFVKKIPKLTRDFKSLNQHIHIAELIKKRTDSREFREQWQGERGILEGESYIDQIEEMIYADVEQKDLLNILRLICLQSVTMGGIRVGRYDVLRKLIIQLYGAKHVYTLNNLEQAGLTQHIHTSIPHFNDIPQPINQAHLFVWFIFTPKMGIFYDSLTVGLIKKKETLLVVEASSTWQTLRKQLKLIDDRINVSKPDDISYVAAGKSLSHKF